MMVVVVELPVIRYGVRPGELDGELDGTLEVEVEGGGSLVLDRR